MSLSPMIEQRLRERLEAVHVRIEDDSAAHAGHRGNGGGGHYSVLVVSPAFEGKPLLARHRLVHALFADELQGAIHALQLTTLAPSEYREG